MKILYVASKYDYMDISRGYSHEHYSCYETLSKMPVIQVVYFPYEKIKEVGRDKMNQELRELVDKEKPDVLFTIMFTDELKKEVINDISKNTSCQTVALFFDDSWRFDIYSKYWAPYFNWVITTDFGAPAKYHKIGYKNIIKIQTAYNHFLYKSLHVPKIYDVSFVGLAHGNRGKIIQKLEKIGIKVKCWGVGWPAGRVSQEEMMRIFSQSKINLNFTKSSGKIWKELISIFLRRDYKRSIKVNNPMHWIDNVRSLIPSMWSKQIKGRNFEVPGCGAFLLTEYVDHLEDYYDIGREVECFRSSRELAEKIDYYLKHEEEREKIAKAGYERTMREHTWEKRFNDIFKTMGLVK